MFGPRPVEVFTRHLRRHHNPRIHVVAAVCAAAGAFLLVSAGHLVIGVLVGLLALVNVAHGAAEHRRPDYRRQWAEAHIQSLRERAARELGTDD